jgi:hypothetical protein
LLTTGVTLAPFFLSLPKYKSCWFCFPIQNPATSRHRHHRPLGPGQQQLQPALCFLHWLPVFFFTPPKSAPSMTARVTVFTVLLKSLQRLPISLRIMAEILCISLEDPHYSPLPLHSQPTILLSSLTLPSKLQI